MIKKTKKVASTKEAPTKKKVVKKTTTTAAKEPAKRVRPPQPTWVAPVDFKPHFLEVTVRTDIDGLLSPDIEVIRYQGRYDPECDPRKKVNVATYDQRTVQGILARLSNVTFVTNILKRLPAKKSFRIVLRVGMSKAKGNIITVGFKQIEALTKMKSGRVKAALLDKKDPIYRRFRKANRILPAAFSKELMPPKITKSRKAEE